MCLFHPWNHEKYYQIVTTTLELAQNKRDIKAPVSDKKLKEGDSVLLRDHGS